VRTYIWPFFGLFIIRKGYAFRQDGRYFVLAERHKSKDTIGIYDATNSFSIARVSLSCDSMLLSTIKITKIKHFPLPTSSMNSLALSPRGNHIAVWEGPLEVCHANGMNECLSFKIS
jgi:hypothetical protein